MHTREDENQDPGQSPAEVSTLPQNERDYIIPARDVRGESVRLYCRAQPAVARLLADIQASHKYPFRTIGDIVRFCVVTGSKRLIAGRGIDAAKQNLMKIDAANVILAEEEYQIQFREFFNRLRAVTEHFLEAKAEGEARRVVSEARMRIKEMAKGYWRGRYLDELQERYGRLLDGKDEDAVTFDEDSEGAVHG